MHCACACSSVRSSSGGGSEPTVQCLGSDLAGMCMGVGQGAGPLFVCDCLSSSAQPPPVRDRNGIITGYNLYYRVTPDGVGVASEAYTMLAVAPTGQHQLGGLLGDTAYDVVMQAVTSAGSGPNSTVVTATALSECTW